MELCNIMKKLTLIIAACLAASILAPPCASAMTPPTGNRPVCADLKDNDGDGWTDCEDQFSCWGAVPQCGPAQILAALERIASRYATSCGTAECQKSLASIRRTLDRVAQGGGASEGDFEQLRQVREDLDRVKVLEREVAQMKLDLAAAKAKAKEFPFCAKYIAPLNTIEVGSEATNFSKAREIIAFVSKCAARDTVDMGELTKLAIKKSGDRGLVLSTSQFDLVMDGEPIDYWSKREKVRFPKSLKWIVGAAGAAIAAPVMYMKGFSSETMAAVSLGTAGAAFAITWGVEAAVNRD